MLRDRPVRALTVGSLKIVCGIVALSPCNRTPTTVAGRIGREQGGPASPCTKNDQ